MGKVFDTQDYLRIELAFTANIENDITSQLIKYKDPNGTEGSWVASLDSVNKTIYYNLPQGDSLGVPGIWTVWSYVTMDDGRILVGEIAKFKIFTEGT